MSNVSVTSIELLRHGHCSDGDIFRGHTDSLLSPLGWQQMQRAIDAHPSRDWHTIISSPLQRCRQFAQQLSQNLSLELTFMNAFREISFGDWDGHSQQLLAASHSQLLQSYWRSPHRVTPPGGERLSDFQQRVNLGWQQLLRQHRGKSILLITHGGVIRSLLAECLNLPVNSLQRFAVPYGCSSQIKIYHTSNEPDWIQLVHHTPLKDLESTTAVNL